VGPTAAPDAKERILFFLKGTEPTFLVVQLVDCTDRVIVAPNLVFQRVNTFDGREGKRLTHHGDGELKNKTMQIKEIDKSEQGRE
jgi:hypothetical protein